MISCGCTCFLQSNCAHVYTDQFLERCDESNASSASTASKRVGTSMPCPALPCPALPCPALTLTCVYSELVGAGIKLCEVH